MLTNWLYKESPWAKAPEYEFPRLKTTIEIDVVIIDAGVEVQP